MPPGTKGTVEMVGGAGQELLSRLLTPEDAVLTEESTPTWGGMQL
jgi:hypothetical protein